MNPSVPHAIIPPLPEFALNSLPAESERDREERLLRQMEKRFGGSAIWKPAWVVAEDRKQEQVSESEAKWQPEFEGERVEVDHEPDWEQYGFRGQVAKLLWRVHGLKKKAIRFLSCNKCGRAATCSRYPLEHKFYVPNGCEVVFCRECAQEARRALFKAYLAVILSVVLKDGCIPKGWVLARVNFTLRSDGNEITPERVKKFNAAVGAVMRKSVGARRGFGMLFVDEVGFEGGRRSYTRERKARGLNLHCHALYFGPWKICRESWERTRDLWMSVTEKKFGVASRGFYITRVKRFEQDPARAVRWALNHMLKYVSKPPAVTPERLSSLIAAFNGAKRVHALGLFYGIKPKREKKDCPCPKCRAEGIVSTVKFEGRSLLNGGCVPRLLPIESLRHQGYEPLNGAEGAGRVMVLSMGGEKSP